MSLPPPQGRLLDDGHVEWTHNCNGREVVATLPMPPWSVVGKKVEPSVHCTACGLHGWVWIAAESPEVDPVGNPWGQFKDAREALGAVMHVREGLAEGRYCECPVPDLLGLMCVACRLRHRGQEVAAVHRLVDAHDFVPGKLGGLMCAVCTQPEKAARHHGQPAVGRTSWGDSVQGVLPAESPEPGEVGTSPQRIQMTRQDTDGGET